MKLAIGDGGVLVDERERVRTITVHVPVPVRNTPIRKQEHDLVYRLRTQRQEIPEHVPVPGVRDRVALLRVNEGDEQDRVPHEEDGSVVAHQIPQAVFRVELDGETPRIADGIRRTHVARHLKDSVLW